MRKLTIVFLAFLIIFSFNKSLEIVSANNDKYELIPIKNNGFESINEDGTIPGWSTNIIGEEDGLLAESAIETNPDYVYSGNHSLKLIDNSPQKGIEFKSDKIAIEGDHYYKVTSQIYADQKSVRKYLKYYDKDGNTITGAEGNILANTPKVWQEEVLEVYAPTNAAYAEIWFYKSPAGMDTLVYIDDVTLEKKLPTNDIPLEIPYGTEVEDLGEMVKIGLSQAAIFAEDESGKLYHYITTTGTPSAFTVVDPLTGKQIFSEPIDGANDPVWGIDQGADGNIYFASSGKLYRFNTSLQKIENLGTNPTGNTTMYDIKASSDGKIYGSTFHSTNQGKFFEYDIKRNKFTDLGVAKEGQTYARGLGVTDDYVYIGVGENSHLMRYDRNSGEITEINIDGVSGEKRMLSQIEIINDTLFVYAGDRVHVINERDEELVRTFDFQNRISPASEKNPEIVYFKKGNTFFSYHIDNDEITQIKTINQPLPDTEFKAHQWFVPDSGVFAGKEVLFSMAAYGETMLYEPISGEYDTHLAELATIGTPINTLEHKDGLLFMGGFQRGMSIYDTNKNEVIFDFPSFHQSESIHFLNDAIYFGTYTGAKIYRFLLDEAVHYNEFGWGNPGLATQIDEQNRPYVMEEGDGMLFIGTFPSGSNYAGALTILEEIVDPSSGNVSHIDERTFQNIAEDRSIIGLAYKDGHIFASTTVYSGSGSVNPPPIQDNATIFKFNPNTETIVNSITPEIEGIDGPIQIIGDLSVGPDGLIWGILDSFIDSTNGYQAAIFALDPETMDVVKSKVITNSPYSTSKYRPYHIRFGENGIMYTTIGRKLIAIDSETLQSKDMLPGVVVNIMTLSENGDIYYVNGNKLFKIKKENNESESDLVQITNIEEFDPIAVSKGTKIDNIPFPKTVFVTLSDQTTNTLTVEWDEGKPSYDEKIAMSYEFTGALDTTDIENIDRNNTYTTKITVQVEEAKNPVEPDEPTEPGDSEESKEPTPPEDTNVSEPEDTENASDSSDTSKPEESPKGQDTNSAENDNKLPVTNTALFTNLLYGFLFFSFGLCIYLIYRYYVSKTQ